LLGSIGGIDDLFVMQKKETMLKWRMVEVDLYTDRPGDSDGQERITSNPVPVPWQANVVLACKHAFQTTRVSPLPS
jgi:hypothetical protein